MNAWTGPEFAIEDCQDIWKVSVPRLRDRVTEALGRLGGSGWPPDLEFLEVSLVPDAEIARIHGEFLGDPAPTDVITFGHGEIIVGVEVAAREARERGWPLERELLLYVIHGLLHLKGLDDGTPGEREEMTRAQEAILDAVWPLEP